MKIFTVITLLSAIGSISAFSQIREIRVATFNTSLFRNSEGDLRAELAAGLTLKPKQVAEIIQRVNPDIILLNEFDYDVDGEAIESFQSDYLGAGQGSQAPVVYGHFFTAESNTGIASCLDLDNNRRVVKVSETSGYGNDAFGFGQFEGQYGMAVLSKFPILRDEVRTWQKFLWKDMPGALLPDDLSTPESDDWYNAEELDVMRLSSKSHWDVPIDVDGETVHLLAAHPTPPVFDGAEDRNGLRNHDEIRLWADYVTPGAGGYLYDDVDRAGGLGADKRFVICGDYNADPVDGDSVDDAILQLLDNPSVNLPFTPEAPSGNTDTSRFNLRVDYVLPSLAGFEVLDGAIFWPTGGQSGSNLISASDHRLVWMDLKITPLISEAVWALEIGIDGDDVVLGWMAMDGVSYLVERSVDLGAWESLGGGGVGLVDGQASFRDTDAVDDPGRRFYRVVAEFSGAAAP